MNVSTLEKYVNEGLISKRKHPNHNLFIYNYTLVVQYEKLWDDITCNSRGLIINGNGVIIARGFKKFFNLEEHQSVDIPNESFEVYDKLDGSLGILYWVDNKPYIATRGSFDSEQANMANEILYDKYVDLFCKLNKDYTYLFEIIYPENRIVVNYGEVKDLFLLAVLDTKTGIDVQVENIGFPIVKRYDGINSLQELKAINDDDKEGFVVKFKSGFRVKMKFAEYVRLHRIITGVSNIAIWEYLSNGKDFQELLDKVPDEFFNWVKATELDLIHNFNIILEEAKNSYKLFSTRKEAAIYFVTQKYPSILFAMLDNKSTDKIIWKMIRPKYSKPFKNDIC